MSKIDVIIPVFKARETIFQTLASIAIQSVVKDLSVHMVVDADGYSYEHLQHVFGNIFDLTIHYLENNGGPAVARQYGLDHSSSPYVTFIDADDTFAGAFALESLVSVLDKDEKVVLVSSVFYEKRKNFSFVQHQNDMTWLHGKMYRRDFLDKYGITFNDTRANEDVGFNTKIKLLETENERIHFLNTLTYYWHWNDSGITRVNDNAYTYNESYFGYVENQIDAINHALKFLTSNDEFLTGYAVEVLTNIYIYLLRIREHRPDLEPQAWEYARRYYTEVMDNLDITEMEDEHFREIVSVTIEQQIVLCRGIIVDMTFHEFMKILLA